MILTLMFIAAQTVTTGQVSTSKDMVDTSWGWRQSGSIHSRRELDSLLVQHKLWVTSEGRKGYRADFTYAVLSGASLRHAVLRKAVLSNAVLNQSDLIGADLTGALLNGASLVGARLDSASLDEAVLDGANLTFAHLEGATFRDAVADNIGLAGSYLRGTDLRSFRWLRRVSWSTYEDGQSVEGAHFDKTTKLPDGSVIPKNRDALQSRIVDFIERNLGKLTLLSLVLMAGLAVLASIGEAARQREQKTVVAKAEESLDGEATFAEHVQRELRVLTERERLVLVLSAGRSRWLFGVGNTLIVASVGAPLGSLTLYLKAPSPEWHLLAFGVGFGLLLLAAARGIARQETQQRDTYFRLTMRVAEYERSISALRIAARVTPAQDPLVHELASKILHRLLDERISDDGPTLTPSAEPTSAGDAPLGQIISTLLTPEK